MKYIEFNSQLEPGKYYICHCKMIYDNGNRSDSIYPLKCDEISGRKFIGSNIWAMDDNNQALEKYDIYGPLELEEMIKDL